MLFLAKLNARVALLVMLALLIVSNLWAGARGFALGDALTVDVLSLVYVALGLTFSASLDSVIYIVAWIVGFSPFLNSFKAGYTRLFAHVGPPAIVAGGLLAGLGEETFFRGVLQRELGILPVALLFALAHAGRGLTLFTIWAFVKGLVFGALYQISGNLLVPMLVHGIHDSAGMFFGRYIFGRYLPPAPTLADWLRALSAPARLVLETTTLPDPLADEPSAPAALPAPDEPPTSNEPPSAVTAAEPTEPPASADAQRTSDETAAPAKPAGPLAAAADTVVSTPAAPPGATAGPAAPSARLTEVGVTPETSAAAPPAAPAFPKS